jgi:hypothetical protein
MDELEAAEKEITRLEKKVTEMERLLAEKPVNHTTIHEGLPVWIDTCLQVFNWKDAIWNEHQRQLEKWGVQARTPFEWMAYLTEEVGELAEAVSKCCYRDGDHHRIVKEAVQVATLAVKIGEMAHES